MLLHIPATTASAQVACGDGFEDWLAAHGLRCLDALANEDGAGTPVAAPHPIPTLCPSIGACSAANRYTVTYTTYFDLDPSETTVISHIGIGMNMPQTVPPQHMPVSVIARIRAPMPGATCMGTLPGFTNVLGGGSISGVNLNVINGRQVIPLQGGPITVTGPFWVEVEHQNTNGCTPVQHIAPRQCGKSCMYIADNCTLCPSASPPLTPSVACQNETLFDDPGIGWAGFAPILRPMNLAPITNACPLSPGCCGDVCALAPSCCSVQWTSTCSSLAESMCQEIYCLAPCTSCPPGSHHLCSPCGPAPGVCDGCPAGFGGDFPPVECGETYCGELEAVAGSHEEHWYELVIPPSPSGFVDLSITVESDLDLIFEVHDDQCAQPFPNMITGGAVAACSQQMILGTAWAPGVFHIRVAADPSVTNHPCGTANGYWFHVDYVDSATGQQCPSGPPTCPSAANSCFSPAPNPGCNDVGCCEDVCQINADCCLVEWHDGCVMLADALCAAGGNLVIEPEPCGSDLNGGCNSTPPAFTDIACGDTVAGTAWAENGIRDTDWYRINHPGGLLEWTVYAEFDSALFILEDQCNPEVIITSATGAAGTVATASANLPPGIYYLFVAIDDFNNHPCGSGMNDYVAFASCGSSICPPATNDCFVTSSNPGCNDPACCDDVCAMDPFCCNTAWDSLCVGGAVNSSQCIGCGDPGNDCCSAGAGPHCDDAQCCVNVCAIDPSCCEVEWNAACAAIAQSNCAICSTPPPNNVCSGAGPVGMGWNVIDFDGATSSDPPEPACGIGGAGSADHDRWWLFSSPCTQGTSRSFDFVLEPDPASPTLERTIAVYTDCPQAGGVLLGCNTGIGGAPAIVSANLGTGQTVVIRTSAPLGGAADISGLLVQYSHPCFGDFNDDCVVDGADVLLCLASWGTHPINCNGTILLQMLHNWGPCP